MKPKYLKMAQDGYENYTGQIGAYQFVDGVSVDMIPRSERDRLAAAFRMEEFAEGEDPIPAGVAYRLVALSASVQDPIPEAEHQTEVEKAAEEAELIAKAKELEFQPVIYSKEELEQLADKQGIAGLRSIASPWKVKSKSIVELIEGILRAQSIWSKAKSEQEQIQRDASAAANHAGVEAMQAVTVSADPAQESDPVQEAASSDDDDDYDTPVPVETPSPGSDEDDLFDAAAAGDMGAALNQE